MKQNEFFLLLIEGLGKTQVEVAKEIGIKPPPLQRYFVGKGSISEQKKEKLAQYLGLNKDGKMEENPFGKNSFWKFYASQRKIPLLPFESLEPLFSIIRHSRRSWIISLTANVEGIERFKQLNPYEKPFHALLIKDDNNNVFLIRKKNPHAFMLFHAELSDSFGQLFKMSREDNRPFAVDVASLSLEKNLYEKFKNDWDKVSREDVEGLFDLAKFVEAMEMTEQEKKHIKNLRSRNLEPLSDEEFVMLTEIRRNQVHPFDVLKRIKE